MSLIKAICIGGCLTSQFLGASRWAESAHLNLTNIYRVSISSICSNLYVMKMLKKFIAYTIKIELKLRNIVPKIIPTIAQKEIKAQLWF